MMNEKDGRAARRRDVLGLAIVGAALAGASAARASTARCDAADTNPGRASLRKALEYASPSNLPGKTCAACAFFTANGANCGKCGLLNGGPVAGDAVCGSWAKK